MSGLAEWFWLRIFPETEVGWGHLMAQVGVRRPISKIAHSQGCGQEASVPHHMETTWRSADSLNILLTWQLATFRANDPRILQTSFMTWCQKLHMATFSVFYALEKSH